MPLGKARRTDLRQRTVDGRPDGVIYRQQYVRCGKLSCKKCPPAGPGHGPYWYGFYWDYQQRTRSFIPRVDMESAMLDVEAAVHYSANPPARKLASSATAGVDRWPGWQPLACR